MRFVLLLCFSLLSSALFAEGDSIAHSNLDDLLVVGDRYTSFIRFSPEMKRVKWDMNMMHSLPKILGNADPLHYVQLLPSVQTNSEYDSGLHVQGCDNAHNMIAIGGVPVYNAAHLLGLFSVFNASHYASMDFSKSMYSCMTSGRLGAELNMELPDVVPDSVCGEFSVGLMSTQGTLRLPIDERSALFLSGRASFLNLLYAPLLEIDDYRLKYGFGDFNLTYLNRLDANNRIWFDVYCGYDKADLNSSENFMLDAGWGNLLFAFHHERKMNSFDIRQSLYTTNCRNDSWFERDDVRLSLPSSISDFGYSLSLASECWRGGLSAVWHRIKPQSPEVTDGDEVKGGERVVSDSKEFLLYGKYFLPFLNVWSLEAGVNTDFYITPSSRLFTSVNPSVELAYERDFGRLAFAWDIRHQYLFRTGISAMGLPIEFMLSSDSDFRPQYSYNYSLSYSCDIFDGDYMLSCELYYKRLYNQLEYDGNIYDFYRGDFSLHNALNVGDGKNYGLNVVINKCVGALSGWLSFSLGRAMRNSVLYGSDDYPASHERLYEINAVATYKFNEKFDVGATFVAASGTPLTVPKRFYIVNGNLISEYGEHNANRLPAYSRLDLSLNYTFSRKDGCERGVNFSLYNALMSSNEIYYRLKFNEGKYAFRGMGFLMRIFPSVSYFCKF